MVKRVLKQKQIYNSVVKIITTNIEVDNNIPFNIKKQSKGVGAGFFIDNKAHVLTAAHVVKNSIDIWVRIPEYGKKIFQGEIVSVYPDFDLAIIFVKDISNEYYLKLGNSEDLELGQNVYALGYPNNSEYPMRTSGTISGRREDYIQSDVPINPGNSGGPLLNSNDKVVGVSSAVLTNSEDSSLIVPIKSFLNVRDAMIKSKQKLIHKNVLGILLVNGNNNYGSLYDITGECAEGQIIKKILKKSPLKNFAKEGDILCYIDKYKIDNYGEISVDWEDGKVPIQYIVKRAQPKGKLSIGIYSLERHKIIKKTIDLPSFNEIYPIRQVFTHVEKLDFEVFGGLIVMDLNLDHIVNSFNHLVHLVINDKIYQPYLIISHIFENSKISQYNTLPAGSILDMVNNKRVRSLSEYRDALKNPIDKNGEKFIIIQALNGDKVILMLNDIMKNEKKMSELYGYNLSETFKFLQ